MNHTNLVNLILNVPLVIYLTGLSSLLLTDLLVSRAFSADEIADWARFRSLVGIAAVIPLIGLDQVLVRSPAASAQLLRLLAVQIPLLGVAVGLVLEWTGLIADWWLGAGLAIGSAASLAVFHYFRSHRQYVLSQLAQQGWKIAAFGLIAIMSMTGWRADLIETGVALLLGTTAAMALAIALRPPSRLHPQNPMRVGVHYQIGIRFMVTGLLLAMSVYAEQLVVNRLGTAHEAALYFTCAVYFLFVPTFLNGYLAFLFGPWVRDRHDRFMALLRGRWLLILAGTTAYALVLNGVGWLLWQAVSPSVGASDPVLQALFLAAALIRSFYLLPSGYLGIFGRPREHSVLIAAQIAAVLPVVALFFGLGALGVQLVHSVAAASTLNWLLRTLVGFRMIGIVARARNQGPAE